MDNTNLNITPAELVLMEHLLSHIQPAGEAVGLPSQAAVPLLSNPQPSQPRLLHSAPIAEPYLSSHVPPPSNPQLSQLTLLCSVPVMELYSNPKIGRAHV